MTDTQHTPGPYERSGITVVKTLPPEAVVAGQPRKLCLAVCENGNDKLSLKKVIANARLFAAAPETAAERDRLLAVNTDLVAALEEWQLLDNIKGLDPSLRRKMKHHAANLSRAAIAKATP